MRKIIKILVEISLFLAKTIILIKKLLEGILKGVIKKPAFFLLQLFYHLLFLPLYRGYFWLKKRLGWSQPQTRRWASLLVKRRLLHILIIVLTIILVYSNLTASRDAIASEEVVGQTLLAKLVSDELTADEQLIEEYLKSDSSQLMSDSYLDRFAYLQPRYNVGTHENLDILEEFEPSDLNIIAPSGETGIATSQTIQPRSGPIAYTVESGDTVSTIAQQFGISVNTILWENNLTAYSYIKPGQKLTILPVSGVSHIVKSGDSLIALAGKYDVDQAEILEANGLTDPNQLKIGQQLIIPGGSKPKATATARATAGRPAIFTEPAESAKPVYGSKMNWPTAGHNITQYYSWRHTGIDIANKLGTAIYAADAGTVEIVGWNSGGYGNQIIIDHGGGKKTRYAHLSSFGVQAGETVSKGQYIGGMGSTGRSSGSHLHFEVIIDGKRYNPLNYVEY